MADDLEDPQMPRYGRSELNLFSDMIRRTMKMFVAAWALGDIDTLMSLFGDDPVYRTSSGTEFRGRDALRDGLTRMCQPPVAGISMPAAEARMEVFNHSCLAYWTLELPNGERRDVVDGIDVITFDNQARIILKDAYRKLA